MCVTTGLQLYNIKIVLLVFLFLFFQQSQKVIFKLHKEQKCPPNGRRFSVSPHVQQPMRTLDTNVDDV